MLLIFFQIVTFGHVIELCMKAIYLMYQGLSVKTDCDHYTSNQKLLRGSATDLALFWVLCVKEIGTSLMHALGVRQEYLRCCAEWQSSR
jgi:hypothetical protein